MNSLSVLALSVTRIHYEFYISCSNLLWINSLFREFTMNSLLIKWIHYESIIFFVVYYKFTIFSWTTYDFTIKYANSLFFISYAYLIWIHSLTREFTMSSLSVTLMHHKSIIFCANSFWIDFFPDNLLWILWITHYGYIIFVAYSLSVT